MNTIQNITTSTVPLSSIVRAVSSQNRVSLPVASGSFVYASFKHIDTVPVFGKGGGYPISRLRALDNLIDQLERSGKTNGENFPDPQGLKSEELDSYISAYSSKIHDSLTANTMFRVPLVSSGLLFNMLA